MHSIAISEDRRLFVVDRGHARFQVFDENGTFLDMFSTAVYSTPYYHFISTDQFLWVADGGTNRILKYDLDGNFLNGWGLYGNEIGLFWGPHSLTTDQEGNLYVAEVFNGRVQKFRPKANADPATLVGQELRYSAAGTESAQDGKRAERGFRSPAGVQSRLNPPTSSGGLAPGRDRGGDTVSKLA